MNVRTLRRSLVGLCALALGSVGLSAQAGAGVLPAASVADAGDVTEGAQATFVVTLDAAPVETATYDYTTMDGTATAGEDYVAASGMVTFESGDTSEQVVVQTTQDAADEPNETFTLVLSNPVGGTIVDGTGEATIVDDDPTPTCPGYEDDPRNQVVGTAGADVLNGTGSADVICGLGGDDEIVAKGGNDLVIAGDGNDAISGGLGNDTILGGNGIDGMNGNEGDDVLNLGGGSDSGDGDQFGYFGAGGGPGNDLLIGGAGADDLFGWGGADQLKGGAGEDVLYGDAGNDTLLGGGAFDFLSGFEGNDVLNGGPAFDCADWEFDTGPLTASLTSGTASGPGIGSDSLVQLECMLGTAKADRMTGNNLGNTLWGLDGADDLFGLGANDYLHGWGGYDYLDCGAGADDLGLAGKGGATRVGCEHLTLSRQAARPDAAASIADHRARAYGRTEGGVTGR